jgi:predicted ATP-dependent endonuclease of OLD family
MYIKSVHIQNIRSITEFKMDFEEGKEPGWHVLIGENGSGKTTILRCLAMGLIGERDFLSLRVLAKDYRGATPDAGSTLLYLIPSDGYDDFRILSGPVIHNLATFQEAKYLAAGFSIDTTQLAKYNPEIAINESNQFKHVALFAGLMFTNTTAGFFSTAFGPFRRFKGGNDAWDEVYNSNPRAAAHMSLFGEDVALTQIEPWLIKLEHKRLRGENGHVLELIKTLLNDRELLPDGTKLKDISPDGLIFQDANGAEIHLHQLSDGFRSVLSLTMELIRQMIRVYGEEKTFENLEKQLKEGKNDDPAINYLPGVVLIDEVDAHLHPTWQTEIGQWFTRYFPKLQFIVTTHSPLICRACGDDGHIWHLRAPGSKEESRKLEGLERDRLVFGDILDAYNTDLFGDDLERGKEGEKLREIYRELNYKERFGVSMTPAEISELERLNQLFQFNVASTRSRVK